MTATRLQSFASTTLATALLALLLTLTGCGDSTDNAATREPGTSTTASSASKDTGETRAAEPTPVAQTPEPPAPENPRADAAEALAAIQVKDGFQVELLYSPDKPTEGSRVALCAGPNNTLYATDQNDNGNRALYHIKPAPVGDFEAKTLAYEQPVDIRGAMGLLWAFDALYVMESNTGLCRVTDSDNDGLLDKKELLIPMPDGMQEHGTHAIRVTPDGKGLYFVAGNHTNLPKLDASRVPQIWDEDQTLKREPDARGHAANKMAPAGWIARCDPDGKNVTLICNGFRNAYDMDVAPNGELFAYDADMEWDLGLPWYRPTRVNHAVSGAEFGWRNGSGKWPAYFEDSLPAVVDIGPGSPVGVTFGTGADFPTRYQSALFLLDWTFGTLYAVHLEPDGATYTGTLETFLTGKPLPLTDVCIGEDGAMYFTAGGRGLNSHLYRVTYYGNKDKSAPPVEPLTELAQLRRELEALHHADPPADQLGFIWQHLGHRDRFVRFAARVALEHQPVDRYLDQARAETDALTRTSAGLALARHRHPDALAVLTGAELEPSNATLSLAWLRAVGVAFARNGEPDDAARTKVLDQLSKLTPSENADVNSEIVRLRVFLNDPGVIEFALGLMNANQTPTPPAWFELVKQNEGYGSAIRRLADNPPPTDQLNLAFMLRNLKDGWTPQTRQTYFAWLNLAAAGAGGESYGGYINNIRNQAIATLTDAEKASLGPLLEPPSADLPPVVQPKGPGRNWTVAQATALVDGKLRNRDYDQGVGLYQATLCSQCHRVGELGGQIGPDLTSVVHTYGLEDLMRAIIEPSADITDQYALSTVTTTDGRKLIGRVLTDDADGVKLQPNVLSEETVDVSRDQIVSIELAPASPMPQGLITPLSAEELRDLTAYILSMGDRDNAMFKQD